jgi:tripartite-type tricarboxylate transporter receptor subunit TctC
MDRRDLLKHCAAAAALTSPWALASAQSRYPGKAVTIVVPFPAGGASDVFSRVLGRKLSVALKQPFIVDNRVGATGLIGTGYLQRAKPDGYTLMIASNSSQVIAPLLRAHPPYDPVNDFEAVSMLGSYPLALQVNPGVAARSVQELVALAKKQPGKLNFGSIGEGSVTHFAGEVFKRKAGVDIVHVPYKGSAALSTALIGGEIDMMFDSIGAGKSFIDAGRVRALAVTGNKRAQLLPNVPSLAESGVPGVDVRVWIGMFAPKGTPRDVIALYERELRQLLTQDADVRRAFADNGTEIVGNTSAEFVDILRGEKTTWQQLITELKLVKE